MEEGDADVCTEVVRWMTGGFSHEAMVALQDRRGNIDIFRGNTILSLTAPMFTSQD